MKRHSTTRSLCSRRNFLRTALAAAAPMIFPSRIFGSPAAPAPSRRINIAQIGLGARSGQLLPAFLAVADAQMVAVCDCDKGRREKAASIVRKFYAGRADRTDWKGVEAYADFREVLARPDIDAVVISTPDHWHVPIAIYAVQAGKDVFVEKPLGISMEWAWKLRDVIDQYGAVFQYGTQQRSGAQFRQACELVRNGYIGNLKRMEAWCPGNRGKVYGGGYDKFDKMIEPAPVPEGLDYDMWLGPAPVTPYTAGRTSTKGAFFVYDNSLGFIAGWGAHSLDIAQWGKGSDGTAPVEFEGTGEIPSTGLFDTITFFNVKCRYADGVELHFMDEITAEPVITKYREFEDHGTTFFGDEGWVSVNRGGLFTSSPSLKKVTLKPGDTRLYASEESHYAKFIRCVRTREETIVPVRAAINSDSISHLSDICIRLGRKVNWDPATGKVFNDPEAERMLRRPLRAPWTI